MGDEEFRELYGQSREKVLSDTRDELSRAVKARDRKLVKSLIIKLKKAYIGDDVMWANEVAANHMVAITMVFVFCLVVIVLILSRLKVFKFNADSLIPSFAIANALILAGIVLNLIFKGERKWMKYVLNFILCVAVGVITAFLGFRAAIGFCIPTVLSIRYFSERFTRIISIVMGVFVFTSIVCSAIVAVSPDLHAIPIPSGTELTVTTTLRDAVVEIEVDTWEYIKSLIVQTYLPDVLQFCIIAIISIKVAKWGHRTIIEQAEVSKEFTRVDTELSMATKIQADMLPNIFPAFPGRPEIDIYATMHPAKEVGGDFYDFFLIDNDHLGVVMADVSGKGVPAALFMMIGKTLIKNQAQLGIKPSEVLMKVNNQLCDNNAGQLFITCWLGVLEISSGKMLCSNAGHEFPAVCRHDGDYEILRDRHGFVMAGLEDTVYTDYEILFNPGDRLFLYTDGVTEATSADSELFGEKRLVNTLNKYKNDVQEKLLPDVRGAIDEFVGTAPQFDDITMLGLKYNGPIE